MKKFIYVVLTTLFIAVLTGCGGGGGGSAPTTTPTEKKGYFIDAPVQGLYYKSDSKDGLTDQNGTFKYLSTDKKITFSVGGIVLGSFELSKMPKNGIVTPSDLLGLKKENLTDENLIKMLVLLQSLDDGQNQPNHILIEKTAREALSDKKWNIKDKSLSDIKQVINGLGKKSKDSKSVINIYFEHIKNIFIISYPIEFVSPSQVTVNENQTQAIR